MTELEARNLQGVKGWRLRRALGTHYPDACTRGQREALTWFYEQKLELALRWLFKRRCQRTARARVWGSLVYTKD